ncbi:tetratricopeptide repeat protein [Streptomyces sp. NPDC001502]|uniref:tetratricopeptide repeat protein n=1 Tax=Streptomyces sp. NPDC001502 TaxID=3364578 RepID=UPI00368957ED
MKWPRATNPDPDPAARAAGSGSGSGSGSGDTVASGDGAIAINTQGAPFLGVASTGANATIVQVPQGELRPPAEVDAPPGLLSLPARHTAFTGRTRELGLLDAALDDTGAAVVQALHGLGGVGKSTLAAHWARTRAGTDNPIWWIAADGPAGLDAGLAALAAALQPALAQLPARQLTERAVQWLATHTGWLLILDDVDDLRDIAPLLARAGTGRVLITSRRSSGWHDTATPIPLDVLTPQESLGLLTHILTQGGTRTVALDGATELCGELGHLPLAVEQAGACIAESGISVRAYLRLLADHPADMYREAGESHDSERTIARIWRITLDRLTDTPLAGQILRTLAWYAPTGIPRALLDPLDNPVAVQRATRRLAAYSMITTTSGDGLAVHPLVQAVARTPDPHDPHRQDDDITAALHRATTLLRTAFPALEPPTWPIWRSLLPHIDALTDRTAPDADTLDAAVVLNGAGVFLNGQGQSRRATAYLQRALDARVRVLGADHHKALASRNNLAGAYESAGDLSLAIPLYEQALNGSVRVLGEDHRDTLICRNNLAAALYRGDLDRAIRLFERTLNDMARVLGDDHMDTLVCRNNLAGAYASAGALGLAIPLYEQNLNKAVRTLGEDDPSTVAYRYNLASTHYAARNLSPAIQLFQRTLNDMERLWGEDNPNTLVCRDMLASTHYAADNLGLAIRLFQRTLKDRERLCGDDHPDTLASRNNLAAAYESAGALDLADSLYERTLRDAMRTLGEDHPLTRTVTAGLTSLRPPGPSED